MINELIFELKSQGVDFIKTVDISTLSLKENRGYNAAILLGMVLSPDYIFRLSNNSLVDYSEFSEKEHNIGKFAEWTADFVIAKGYKAFAQSDNNLGTYGLFDDSTKSTPLPHKKIAIMAGLGWIGKNNLLVTREYGCAVCMCSILTDAPLPTENHPVIVPKCGECTVCKDICPAGCIHGTTWEAGINRDCIVDVYNCIGCLKCLSHCPWSQKRINDLDKI